LEKIIPNRQFADLGVQTADLFRSVLALAGPVLEYRARPCERLFLPQCPFLADPVRMNLVTGCNLSDRLVAPQRFQRHTGLEVSREPASLAHEFVLLVRRNTP
jgi:hypothetical protein